MRPGLSAMLSHQMGGSVSNQVKVEKKPSRCPYCHADVEYGLVTICPCGAAYHKDCADDLSQCASCPETSVFGSAKPISVSPGTVETLINKITRCEGPWEEVYDIAKSNSKGRVWLVGGKVYRTLAEILHGVSVGAASCDYDFITTYTTWFNHIPGKWYVTFNTEYGESLFNPYTSEKCENAWRYFKEGRQVLDLMTFKRATQAGHPANLDGYFKSVPLNVQAVALDIDGRQLLGPGVEAICRKIVSVNNREQAEGAANRAAISIDQFVEARARSLGFSAKSFAIIKPVDRK